MKRKVTTYDYACLNEARDILIRIDMPDNLVNPRSVMTLAALAEIGPNKKWRNASEGYHGTHYVVNFINENFPNKAGLDTKPYAENSRENITISLFLQTALKRLCLTEIIPTSRKQFLT